MEYIIQEFGIEINLNDFPRKKKKRMKKYLIEVKRLLNDTQTTEKEEKGYVI